MMANTGTTEAISAVRYTWNNQDAARSVKLQDSIETDILNEIQKYLSDPVSCHCIPTLIFLIIDERIKK
jgi:hypothetical protein